MEHNSPEKQVDDGSLIQRYKDTGDLEVLGDLYEPYIPLVYGVSFKYLANKEESQDAVMGIFEKLVDDLRKHEVTNFKSWLHVCTRNYCLMKLRSSKYKKEAKSVEIDGHEHVELSLPVHHEDVRLEDDLQLLEQCIEELKNEQRNSVKLFFIEQKCYQEIVEATGYEMKKVKSYIQNGKRNLKLCVEKKREQD